MIRVLVVEDERPTARVIARLVEQHPAYTVAGIETNGERALRFLRENQVDLVISDIQMPVMDGLQLLEQIQSQWPDCLTILLTGFSQFEYAKKAIQCRTFDYVLKPVDQAALHQVLDKAAEVCRRRRYEAERRLLEGALNDRLMEQARPKWYHLMLTTGELSLWEQPEPMQWQADGCHLFPNVMGRLRLLVGETSVWNQRTMVEYWKAQDVDLVCAVNAVQPAELKQTILTLCSHLEQGAKLFRPTQLLVDTTQPISSRSRNPLREMQPEQAVEAICARDEQGIRACIALMWKIARENGSLRIHVHTWLEAILMDSRIGQQLSASALSQNAAVFRRLVEAAGSQADCTEQLTEQLLGLLQESAAKRDEAAMAAEMAQYLQRNYHLNLSIEALARQYGFVPKQLNKVFKKHLGQRPAEYLLDLRIQRAKYLLETMPEIMVKDVAASVGYSDHHYFSKVFQRATGHWPTEYQQEAQEK